MKRCVVAALVAAAFSANPARGQSLAAEAAVTAGYSTEDVAAPAAQLRVFGDAKAGVRFYLEAAWATRSETTEETDAFGAAYPYGDRIQAMEAYGERLFRPGAAIVSVRTGRYRTPFGISGRGDHAYNGFLRAPLIRYDDYYALANTFLEHGADVVVGIPQLSVETSLGVPADVGGEKRRSGLDTVVRAQGYHGPWIVGVSHIRTLPNQPAEFALGRAVFTGVDVRWTRDGVQARGEWITGQPFDGTTTDGWYADVMLHRPQMGPVTIVLRAEQLNCDSAEGIYGDEELSSLRARRQTIGAKVRLPRGLTAQANLLHQSGIPENDRSTALDFALTYSIRLH